MSSMASILSIAVLGNFLAVSFCHLVSMAPISPRTAVGSEFFSITMTFAPASAAVMRAGHPAVPRPTIKISVSRVSVMSAAAISGASPSQSDAAESSDAPRVTVCPLACEIQSAAAVRIALDVTVAVATTSTSADCFCIIASDICGPILPPMSGVSPDTSMSTAVMALSLNVMVTFTSLAMPLAVAEYVPGVNDRPLVAAAMSDFMLVDRFAVPLAATAEVAPPDDAPPPTFSNIPSAAILATPAARPFTKVLRVISFSAILIPPQISNYSVGFMKLHRERIPDCLRSVFAAPSSVRRFLLVRLRLA